MDIPPVTYTSREDNEEVGEFSDDDSDDDDGDDMDID
jgi:hypothetical protein